MKIKYILLLLSFTLFSCSSLPRFIVKKNLEAIEKIEIKDNKIIIDFKNTYSPKAFNKDLIHTFTPILIINNDTLQVLEFNIYGEKLNSNTISYKYGGEIVLSDTINYNNEIKRILIVSKGSIRRSKSPYALTLPDDKIFELTIEK